MQCAGGAIVNRTDSLLLRALVPIMRAIPPPVLTATLSYQDVCQAYCFLLEVLSHS